MLVRPYECFELSFFLIIFLFVTSNKMNQASDKTKFFKTCKNQTELKKVSTHMPMNLSVYRRLFLHNGKREQQTTHWFRYFHFDECLQLQSKARCANTQIKMKITKPVGMLIVRPLGNENYRKYQQRVKSIYDHIIKIGHMSKRKSLLRNKLNSLSVQYFLILVPLHMIR